MQVILLIKEVMNLLHLDPRPLEVDIEAIDGDVGGDLWLVNIRVSGSFWRIVQLKAESSGQSQQGTHLLPGGRGDVAAAPAVEAGQRGQA